MYYLSTGGREASQQEDGSVPISRTSLPPAKTSLRYSQLRSRGSPLNVAPIAPDAVGPKISVSNSPYRIRLNLPSGDAQVVRIGLVFFSMYPDKEFGQNLTYETAGKWKADDYVFHWVDKGDWDHTLTRYRFEIWFNWQGGKFGSSVNIWHSYGNISHINNSNERPVSEDPAEAYYYIQPFNADVWDQVYYFGDWLFNPAVDATKKGTINLFMNNTYGHFTHGFSNVVDNI